MDPLIEAFEISINSGLLWHEFLHAVFAGMFSLVIWFKTKKIKYTLVPFYLAYILDIDHLLDYWGYYGFVFSFPDFIQMEYFFGPGRSLVPLHAWEWVIILTIFSFKKGWKSYVSSFNIGLIAHLLLDSINVGSFLFYSIIYRYIVGFRIFS